MVQKAALLPIQSFASVVETVNVTYSPFKNLCCPFQEDSAHYLLFSLMFLFCEPVTVALGPISLFAVLHLASYSLTLLDCLGTSRDNNRSGHQRLILIFHLILKCTALLTNLVGGPITFLINKDTITRARENFRGCLP